MQGNVSLALPSIFAPARDFCSLSCLRFNLRFVLAIADDPYGFPLQGFPRVEFVRIPDLNTVTAIAAR